MLTPSINRVTANTGVGTATYVFSTDHPPAFLIRAVPGAQEALAAWQAANAEGLRLYEVVRQRSAEVAEARALAAKHQITPEALTSAEAAKLAAEADVANAARRALAALKAFDVLFTEDGLSREVRVAAALEHAVSTDARARALWDELLPLLEEREEAYGAAGRPLDHQHWSRRLHHNLGGEPRKVLDPMKTLVTAFPDLSTYEPVETD